MHRRLLFLITVLTPCTALGQRPADSDSPSPSRVPDKSLQTGATAGANVRVSKTAFVNGLNVCGVIRITNRGRTPAALGEYGDSLEVHFPSTVSPPPLPAGSTSNWFRVGLVPVVLPDTVPPGETVTIDYCFPLCLAADYAGANSMRNVITIAFLTESGRANIVTTRSTSFPPPVLDCQACCLTDGSCIDTVPDACGANGGLSRGADTHCATTECPQACCHFDHTCSDDPPSACGFAGGESQGAGTDCATTQCCRPLGDPCGAFSDCCEDSTACVDHTCCIALADAGCTSRSDCCEDEGVAICEEGRCCAPNRAADSCHDITDCCDTNATCSNRTCCIALGESGCTNLVGNDCCDTGRPVICNDAGKCCAPTGVDACTQDSDCCDPAAKCTIFSGDDFGTCCIRLADSGCEDSSDCCDDGSGTVTCSDGKCCAPNGAFSSCSDDSDCCDENETCNLSGVCCVALGDTGCSNLGARCCDFPGSTIVCDQAGRCCGPTGIASACTADTDCCDAPQATCNSGTCCVRIGALGCETISDCCDDRLGMTCDAGGKCCVRTDVDTHSACINDTDCCHPNATCNVHRACCIATGVTGCSTDSHCCNSAAICQAASGRCCARNGTPGACSDAADCCDSNAICNLNSTCCIPQLRSCATNSDCCSGLCTGGICEGVIGP